ncbi:non-homologous end-joining DNA ligase [Streptomyces aurantiacus]|uniref:Putative DNA ligase-like protein n=1 Tax=Streptomyces aurantiacus JA 4570 TaxID=1286094 RepID=S3ZTA1_9ACTN|nr:non-homologous end-joining DNA ligase [Streptomyces aurantiacus]EPH41635.1 putative DNA ligase-like protein [Streptomyces aurantiacus JA 4570]
MTTTARKVRAGRRTVEVHRPDKVLLPPEGGDGAGGARGRGKRGGEAGGRAQDGDEGHGCTKGDLADYYRSVAPFMLPHLRGRPLMLERHPDGVPGPMFMQKDTPDHYPDWITRAEVPKEGGTVTHTVCDDSATLLYLADQACVTLHRWLSRVGRIDRPDRMVFDLDPAKDGAPQDVFGAVRDAARLLGELLDQVGLPSALMTTGSRGLHVIVPLNGRHHVDDVRDFAKEVAALLAESRPDELTTAARKKDRGGRLYLDVQRNAYAQTAVAPFSVRARPGAPVAVPLAWEQLDDPGTHAARWTVADALEQARTDPWAGLLRSPRALGPARRKLRALRGT